MLKLLDNKMAFGRIRIMRKKSVLSQRTQSTFDGNFAHGKPGWWEETDAVGSKSEIYGCIHSAVRDHSVYHCVYYLKDFLMRWNKNSTSVGGKDGESCGTAETRNLVS